GAVDDVRMDNTLLSTATIGGLARPRPPSVTVLTALPAPSGTAVQVRFDANGDTNVTSFKYSVDTANFTLSAPATGGVATVSLNSLTVKTHTLYVEAIAAANPNYPSLATIVTGIKVVLPASLTGVVTDAGGNAVTGATVTLQPGGATATSA